MEPIILFSADGHGSMPPDLFRDYLETRYHDALDELSEDNDDWVLVASTLGTLAPEISAVVDPEGVIASGGWLGAVDVERRLQEMDREGVAAEMVFPGTQLAVAPFFGGNSRPFPLELRAAGVHAYHRWLADFVAQADGRLGAVAEPLPCLDIDDALAELRWVADHGFVATQLPGVMADPALPPLYDPYYEPFWATCAELGLVLSIHAGFGSRQGAGVEMMRKLAANIRSAKAGGGEVPAEPGAGAGSEEGPAMMPKRDPRSDFVLQVIQSARRGMCQLMLAGAFDRHPDLKLVLTEVRSDWVPASLAQLDARFGRGDTPLKKKPSEYWASNCFVGATAIHPAEVERRHDIGVANIMFGHDYPHDDGTWPYTWDWVRAAFAGVPEDEARLMLGENAVACYGLDRTKLAGVADRIGPRPLDLLGEHHVDPGKVEHWHERAGFNNPVPPSDVEVLDRVFDEDLRDLVGSAPTHG